MVGGDRKRHIALLAVAVVGVSLLAGCAAEPAPASGDFPAITLAASKSPVQLLRNDAAGRIPPAVIATVEDTKDVSVACLDQKEDPKRLVRSWRSTALVTVVSGSQWRLEAVVANLTESFVDQGWEAEILSAVEGNYSQHLVNQQMMAEITVTGAVDEYDAEKATIEVQVMGPCVETDGAESDEVKKAEGR